MTEPENRPPQPSYVGAACSPSLRLEILGGVPFFADLPPDDLEEVDASFHERGYGAGEPVFTAGDPADELFVVARGDLKWVRHTAEGRDVLLDMLVPGEFFGSLPLLGDDVHRDTVRAHTPCCVLAVPADDFQAVLRRYPPVALRVLDHVAQRLREAQDHIRHLSASTADARIAAILLRLADKLGEQGSGGDVVVPLSQQDLAEMAGTTLETVNRTLRGFRDAGAVATGRGRVIVSDAAALARAADTEGG